MVRQYTLGFYISHFDYRGTTDALYNYADYNERLLNNKSVLFQRTPPLHPHLNVWSACYKFLTRFKVILYATLEELTHKCKEYEIDAMYFLVAGNDQENCNMITANCPDTMPRFVHCVFSYYKDCDVAWHNRAVFAGVSNHVASINVDHMVVVDNTQHDFRSLLHIPKDAVVFGRHGGIDCYDPIYVTDAICELAEATEHDQSVYFLFMPMPSTFFHRRRLPHNIIFLPMTVDKRDIRMFINTCDAMIHAKAIGESFGLACLEFSAANKPVITHKCTHECNMNKHIENLGNKAWLFEDKQSCLAQMKQVIKHRDWITQQDWDVTSSFTPEKVMQQFQDVFLSQIDSLTKTLKSEKIKQV